jgi:hypothetical protein
VVVVGAADRRDRDALHRVVPDHGRVGRGREPPAAAAGVAVDLDRADLPTRPDLVPLAIHRDRERGYSFLYPATWRRFTFDAGNGPGELFAESADDLATHLSLEVMDLPTAVRGRDLPSVEKAFLEGLGRLAGSTILRHDAYDTGFLVGVEAEQTFVEQGQRRRRWVRLLYRGKRQARLVAQGATEAEYERWLVRFKPAMTTFNFGDIWPEP